MSIANKQNSDTTVSHMDHVEEIIVGEASGGAAAGPKAWIF
jgi:hypothetical protein